MKIIHSISHSYEETLALGSRFAKAVKPGDIVCLFGELGSGKTAFVRGLVQGLGKDPSVVHSPTFVIMSIYEGKLPVYHFDLYRITGAELAPLGYEEFFYGNGISVVEWSERLGDLLPENYWRVDLHHAGGDERKVDFSATGEALQTRFQKLARKLA